MHLGRAAERARREGGLEHIHIGEALFERAFHIAHDVHHVAIALHTECVRHLHRTDLRDAPDVVARQVDQHHMLGALLGVGHQLRFGRLVPAPASHRADGCRPAGRMVTFVEVFSSTTHLLLSHQDFRRGTDHMESITLPLGSTEVVVVHVGAGVERTQCPVQAQGRGRDTAS